MNSPSMMELLPGVAAPDASPPVAVCNPRDAVERARRRRKFRDLIDGLVLLSLDYLFVSWPDAHVPFLTRSQSMTLLVAMHAIVIGYWILSRELPPWRARRIASTWTQAERVRLARH